MVALAQRAGCLQAPGMQVAVRLVLLALIGAASVFVGCQGPTLAQRIAADQEAFNSWSPEVQQAINEGRIEVGFTPAQVRVALGEPDHASMEINAEEEVERWVYTKKKPAIGIGFGVGSYGRSSGVSGGIGTTIGGGTDVLAVVRFKNGVVDSFETADSK